MTRFPSARREMGLSFGRFVVRVALLLLGAVLVLVVSGSAEVAWGLVRAAGLLPC